MEYESNYLAHYGIRGQRWGIRRFQNPDGTLTEAGKRKNQRAINRVVNLSKEHIIKQGKANMALAKAERRVYSRFNPNNPARPYKKAIKEGFKLDKVAFKGKKMVDGYIKKGLPLDKTAISWGKAWADRADNTSKMLFNAALNDVLSQTLRR